MCLWGLAVRSVRDPDRVDQRLLVRLPREEADIELPVRHRHEVRLVVGVVLTDLTCDVEAEENDIALDGDVEQSLVRPVVLDLGEPKLDLVDARGQTVELVLGLAAARGLVEPIFDGAADSGPRTGLIAADRVSPRACAVRLVLGPGVLVAVDVHARSPDLDALLVGRDDQAYRYAERGIAPAVRLEEQRRVVDTRAEPRGVDRHHDVL